MDTRVDPRISDDRPRGYEDYDYGDNHTAPNPAGDWALFVVFLIAVAVVVVAKVWL